MTAFQSRAHIKIDPKGRLSFPTLMRQSLGRSSSVFITNSLYQGKKFLDMFTLTEWKILASKIAKLPQLKSEVQAFQRFYISSGTECELDSQGRILIPPHLREYAGLKSDIVLVGMGHKLEIWDEKLWKNLFAQLTDDFEKVQSVIAELETKK